jgi:Ca-activated chloride channel family protein
MTPHTRLAWVLFFASVIGCATPKPAPVVAGRLVNPITVAVDPKLIDMTAEATMGLLAASSANELGVRILISAHDLADAKRPPLNLGLVLDTSGSMDGDAIVALRSSAKALVDKLREGDRLSIVIFHSHADVLVPSVVIDGHNRTGIDHAIDGIVATGTTDLQGGLAAGLSQVVTHQLPVGINRLVLLSDGVPNVATALPQVLASIHQYGISVTSLGFGADYDTNLMTQIARDTGGNFHYLEKPEEVAAVFDDELTKMTTVVGRNLQLALEPGPGVTILPLPGLQVGGDGKVYTTVGDLAAGETRDLMIPIKVSARAAGSTAELVQATLTFDDVVGNSGRPHRDAFVGVKTSGDAAAVKASIKVGLEVARIRSSAAAAILTAMAMARSGEVAAARQQIALATATVRTAVKTFGKDANLEPLIKQLDDVAHQLAQIVPTQDQLQIGGGAKHSSIDKPIRDYAASDMVRPVPATAPASVEPMLRRAEETAAKTIQGRE